MIYFSKSRMLFKAAIFVFCVLGVSVAIVSAFNDATQNPPLGNGAFNVLNSNIGIGTTNPLAKLHVVGDINISNSAAVPNSGDGHDGAVTISSAINLNSTNLITGRACAEGGDAVNYSVTNLTANTATLSVAPSAGCLLVGDEILLINLQGGSGYFGNVGNYETLHIQSIASNVVTFTANKKNFYGNSADDTNIGVGRSNQRVILQRVPNYTNVTVNSGGSLTANSWNGITGGVIFFRSNGTLANNGVIGMTGAGYAGGAARSQAQSYQGESYPQVGALGTANNYGGGGGMAWIFGHSGAGGGYGSSGGNGTGGETGGSAYGAGTLTKLFLGSGGGGAGCASRCYSGAAGGIIVAIFGNTVSSAAGSAIASAGASPVGCNDASGDSRNLYGPGSGAGGSILIQGAQVSLGNNLVSAAPGVSPACIYPGGSGSAGRIAVYYSSSFLGTTNNPAAVISNSLIDSAIGYLSALLVDSATGKVGINNPATFSGLLTIKAAAAGNVLSVQDTSGSNKFTVDDSGAISAGAINANSLTLTSPLLANSGGTGLNSPGASGNILTSNGAIWVSQAIKLDYPSFLTGSGGNAIYSPQCPDGKKVMGGGCYNSLQCAMTENAPVVPPGEWLCQWASTCTGTGYAYVICK